MSEAIQYICNPLLLVMVALGVATIVEGRTKKQPDDSLIVEARKVCDACPHAYQRNQLHGVVDAFIARIEDAKQNNQHVAEREERRRLHEWVTIRQMGS